MRWETVWEAQLDSEKENTQVRVADGGEWVPVAVDEASEKERSLVGVTDNHNVRVMRLRVTVHESLPNLDKEPPVVVREFSDTLLILDLDGDSDNSSVAFVMDWDFDFEFEMDVVGVPFCSDKVSVSVKFRDMDNVGVVLADRPSRESVTDGVSDLTNSVLVSVEDGVSIVETDLLHPHSSRFRMCREIDCVAVEVAVFTIESVVDALRDSVTVIISDAVGKLLLVDLDAVLIHEMDMVSSLEAELEDSSESLLDGVRCDTDIVSDTLDVSDSVGLRVSDWDGELESVFVRLRSGVAERDAEVDLE